jgi:hypothetical protein
MSFVRQHRWLLLGLGLLAATSVPLIEQVRSRQSWHVELREAFILLHTKGYTNEAGRLYQRLLQDIATLSDRALIDDFQRTLLVVDPGGQHPDNLLWKYHWTASNELERRSESTLMRALRLADEIKQP